MSGTALSIAGHLERRKPYKPYLHEMGHIPPAYCYRCWYGKESGSCGLECAEALEREILLQGPDEVAAFIAEPVSGNSICAAYPKREGYFKRIREICDQYDVLYISDEVMTGVGRTGSWFGYQQFDVRPDIVTMGKALSGGYFPVGAVGCRGEIAQAIAENSGFFFAGYSWTNNPMAAAIIVKTIEYKKQHQLLENVQRMGGRLGEKLARLKDRHETIGDIRGRGLMWGIEFVKERSSKAPFEKDRNFAGRIVEECARRKMFVQSGGANVMGVAGDMVLIGPAFIVKEHEIDEIVSILDQVIGIVEGNYAENC